jgi:DNA polymerase III subunit delta
MLGAVAELKPVYLIGGSDRPKVDRAVRRLRDRIGADATETLAGAETSADEAIASCNSLGLFGGEARLVLVDGVDRWKVADAKAIAAYLESPAPATVLALVAEEVKRDGPLAKACGKGGDLLLFEAPRKRDLPRWVAEQFGRVGAEAEPDACKALVELCGDDLQALTVEIDKLATWAAGETIRAEHVGRLAATRPETSIFALTDAWGRRDLRAVLSAADSLLESSPRELTRVIGLLAHHVGRVRACQVLAAEGIRPRDAAGRLKVHPFAAEKAFGHAENFSVEELRDAVVRLAELDYAVKGGSRLAGDLELARALVDITRPADATASASS